MDQTVAKKLAAEAALALLPDEGVVGLGTGSTAQLFIDGVGRLVKAGKRLVGVPTSEASRLQALALGIPLLDDEGPWDIEIAVDGADEVSENLDVLKGGGGCHTREKIVNDAARKNVIVVDESKLSRRLGEKWPIPVEVLAFGHRSTAKALTRFGEVTMRTNSAGPFRTDCGNYVYDVRAGVIEDPVALEQELTRVPGVVETGLFVGRVSLVIVAGSEGVRRLEPANGPMRAIGNLHQ